MSIDVSFTGALKLLISRIRVVTAEIKATCSYNIYMPFVSWFFEVVKKAPSQKANIDILFTDITNP